MSTATDLAELDAAIAENELSDEEAESLRGVMADGIPLGEALESVLTDRQGTGTPPPAETEPPLELGEPSDKQIRDLEKETDRHIARVQAIMGGHVAGFDFCDSCGGIGLTPPGPRPQSNENFKACEVCAGFGQVKTGSLRQGHEARDCPTCHGRGYLERLESSPQPQPLPTITMSDQTVYVPTQGGGNANPPQPAEPAGEQWGVPTWMGDPHIGNQ